MWDTIALVTKGWWWIISWGSSPCSVCLKFPQLMFTWAVESTDTISSGGRRSHLVWLVCSLPKLTTQKLVMKMLTLITQAFNWLFHCQSQMQAIHFNNAQQIKCLPRNFLELVSPGKSPETPLYKPPKMEPGSSHKQCIWTAALLMLLPPTWLWWYIS